MKQILLFHLCISVSVAILHIHTETHKYRDLETVYTTQKNLIIKTPPIWTLKWNRVCVISMKANVNTQRQSCQPPPEKSRAQFPVVVHQTHLTVWRHLLYLKAGSWSALPHSVGLDRVQDSASFCESYYWHKKKKSGWWPLNHMKGNGSFQIRGTNGGEIENAANGNLLSSSFYLKHNNLANNDTHQLYLFHFVKWQL